jgi:hypothetical protein
VPNESEITNKLTDRAKQSWNLARKVLDRWLYELWR